MVPKEPTRAQFSSRLAYQAHTPNFLLKFKNRMNGIPDDDEEYDEEFEYVGDGREPVPRRPRPPIPERPEGNVGSEDEEDVGDEKPQVVVLKEGKHLTEREAENIRRAEKGLSPLPDVATSEAPSSSKDEDVESKSKSKSASSQGLSFSSSSATKFKSSKRKATSQLDELKYATAGSSSGEKEVTKASRSKNPAKKTKKESKTLLSFGDDT